MALTDTIKQVLRIDTTVTAYDEEVNGLIAECKDDLALSGVLKISEDDNLICRAIKIYAKANFGWDNPDAERLDQSYKMLKAYLSTSLEYAYFKVTINAVAQTEVTFDGTAKQTDSGGVVEFYSRQANNVKYTVNSVDYYADITDDITLTPGE